MFSVLGDELIEAGVDSREEISPGTGEHLRDSFEIRATRSAELLLVQVVSSASRAEHIVTSVSGTGILAFASKTKDAGGDACAPRNSTRDSTPNQIGWLTCQEDLDHGNL
jgi:hypothetical protein